MKVSAKTKASPDAMRVIGALCVGAPAQQARNLIIEGDNLQAMAALQEQRGQVDLILTDPPYNTGTQFRYNDKWDDAAKGPRHAAWMAAMQPRLTQMRGMLKPSGVIAICIDDNALFYLGMMLDGIFGEENRIAIINWQKSYAPKSDSTHVSTATEYVLVYAKDKSAASTGLEARTGGMDSKYANPDKDPRGDWCSDNPTVATPAARDRYGIQSPFTGDIHYPGSRAWSFPKKSMKAWLEEWGATYEEADIGDGRHKALMVAGSPIPRIPKDQNLDNEAVVRDETVSCHAVIRAANAKAEEIRNARSWPFLYFMKNGHGRPRVKRYLADVKKGRVATTYWAAENYDAPLQIGSQSWDHAESGHSQTGINELNAILGKGHGFETVKPLKLFKKIIQLWCGPDGLVLDPYAGSGTSAHAVLELNHDAGANRRFILIEQGSPDRGDAYARSLTRERVKRAITGERPDGAGQVEISAPALGGGFQFLTIE